MGGDSSAGHVFISYAREDSAEVNRLQRVLESAGIRVWRDTDRLWPGQDWPARIRAAITQDALVFIACFSSESVARDESYQNEEMNLAISRSRLLRPDVTWLIPVRFDDCVIPDLDLGGGRTLSSIQRADMFGDDYSREAKRLIAVVRELHEARYGTSGAAGTAVPDTDSPVARYPLPAPAGAGLRSSRPMRFGRIARGGLLAVIVILIAVFMRADQADLTPTLHLPGWVSAIAFSADGRLLACGTGDTDDKVTLWNIANPAAPALLSTITGYGRTVRTIVFSPRGHFMATASWDGTVTLWNVAHPTQPDRITTINVTSKMVEALAFSPDGHVLAAGDQDGENFLWQVTGGGRLLPIGHPFPGHAGFVRNAAFSPDGRTLATVNGDHLVILWNVAKLAHPVVIARLDSYSDFASAAVFTPDGKFLATSSTNGNVMLWRVTKPTHPILVATFTAFTGDWVMGEAYSPDGRILATANRPNAAVLWNVSDPARPRQETVISIFAGVISSQPRYVEAVAFSPSGRWLAVASYNHTVSMWRLPG